MATYTAVAGGGNWSANATWGGAGHPVAGDTANLDATSGNVTVDVASACAVLDCTGYTGTLTMSANMTTTGNVTFVTGMTVTPNTNTWTFGTSTFKPAGRTLYNLAVTNAATLTLSTTDLLLSGSLTCGTSASATKMTGRQVTMVGTGTVSMSNFASALLSSGIIINTAGTVTFSGVIRYGINGSTLTYTAGTIANDAGSFLGIKNNVNLNLNGSGFCETLDINAGTTTLQSSANYTNFQIEATGTALAAGTYTITLTGNFTNNKGATAITGNNTFIFNGTSVLDGNTNFYNMTVNAGKTVTFDDADTFTVTNNFNALGTAGSHVTMNTDNPGTTVDFDVTGTVQTVEYVDATDLDSSGGDAIATTGGSVTNCDNWTLISLGGAISSIFFGCNF